MDGKNAADIPFLWGARFLMFAIFLVLIWMVYKGWQLNKFEYEHFEKRSK